MKSNYQPIGKYIREVNIRNRGLEVNQLMGLSIEKRFIPSIANTIGTDMSTYRIIKRNQFAYGPVTSRNGEKITIALFQDYDISMISQAYTVFEIIDTDKLLPEYLMMWFRRPEFDRYARFMSHGSVRELFGWEELCNTTLPVPHIDKQREIVQEYKTITDRIELNKKLCQKLEETAQAIYREWFVEGIDKENLQDGWNKSKIGNEVETLGGGTPSTEVEEFWTNGKIQWYSPTDVTRSSSIFIFDSANKITQLGLAQSSAKLFPADCLMVTSRATIGKVVINTNVATTNQGFITIIPNDKLNVYFLYCWINTQIEEIINLASGSTFLEISKTDFRNLDIIIPNNESIIKFRNTVKSIFDLIKSKTKEILKLSELKELLLSKMATMEK